ncbi:MAG TPA: TetR/AcrR family transcriptional regulator [Acidimicrobiales bacterium]|nr:TetR/AcrR family transcriptional regulator [Acidimicrobiales bacterium]
MVAREAFASGDGAVPLGTLARRAGVGIGTLYRHFPTREALVDAVYASELDAVTASASGLLERHPADVAMRRWLDRYAEFMTTKRGMLDALRSGWAAGTIATPDTRARITQVIDDFLSAGARQGLLRDDVLVDDVTAALVGVFLSTTALGQPDQVGRLLDLLMAGLRPESGRRARGATRSPREHRRGPDHAERPRTSRGLE